ncbi:MAG TPA: hypothetical protein LFW21_06525 [Rickettsia endosymbiont of Pyrocoelia pectoralis]|nr:hypothetical protein [Rickettsia endosymbiont of Pyrocoelia pectoralis]
MKKAHVFKYSQIVKTDRMKNIAQFSQHTSLTPPNIGAIAINEEKESGVIDQYKKGTITTEEFRTQLNKLIENAAGKPVTNIETFDNCWNAMCVVESETLAKLHDLQQKHDFHIHIIAGTNELQHNYIQAKIPKAPQKPSISYTLSYELSTLDKDLLKQNAEQNLKAQDYEPVWHIEEQHNYETNALEILGNYYGESSV